MIEKKKRHFLLFETSILSIIEPDVRFIRGLTQHFTRSDFGNIA